MRNLKGVVLVTFIAAPFLLHADPVSSPANCDNMTWQDCAKFVKDQLPALKDKPESAIPFVVKYWAPKFETVYRNRRHDDETLSDLEKIQKEIEGKVNPVNWATDKVLDAALKSFLPRIATIVAILDTVSVEGVLAFLWPSSTATEGDELRHANDEIHRSVFTLLDRKASAKGWQARYLELSLDAYQARQNGPVIHKP